MSVSQFFSLLLKILTEAGRFIILWISYKGDEGADTDLMFQFCLPNFCWAMQRLVDHSFAKLTSFLSYHHCIQWKNQHSLLNITFVRALPFRIFVATSSIFLSMTFVNRTSRCRLRIIKCQYRGAESKHQI